MESEVSIKSIELPVEKYLRNLKNARQFAIDIGGSLAKLAYCSTVPRRSPALISSEPELNYANVVDGETQEEQLKLHDTDFESLRLYFVKFETKYIGECLDFISHRLQEANSTHPDPVECRRCSIPMMPSSPLHHHHSSSKIMKATGGGAFKYFDLIEKKLGVRVDKEDEMECLIKGCNFLLKNIPDEAFTYHHDESTKYCFQTTGCSNVFPYLLVNIGSGVSIVKVEDENSFERVGGTSMGGGTFWGLGSLLTDAQGFDELLELAEQGDHRNIDMLVGDIYGGAYAALGLPVELIASSFGKAVRSKKDAASNVDSDLRRFNQCDIARSLLLSISNCIGQISSLYARLHGLKRIYFAGYFIRGHPLTMRTITYATNFWSKGQIRALYLRHEGYLGAVGAFLKGAEEESKRTSHVSVVGRNATYSPDLESSPSPLIFDFSSGLIFGYFLLLFVACSVCDFYLVAFL